MNTTQTHSGLPSLTPIIPELTAAGDVILTAVLATSVMKHLWASLRRSQNQDQVVLLQLLQNQQEINRQLFELLQRPPLNPLDPREQ